MNLYRLLTLFLSVTIAAMPACGGERPTQFSVVEEARLSFTHLPDGPPPRIFGNGEASWSTDPSDATDTQFRIVNGKLTNDATVSGRTASYYTSASLGGPITEIGARWTFTARGGTPGAMALVVSQQGLNRPFPVHLVITPEFWSFGVWPPDNDGSMTELKTLAQEHFNQPLKQDGVHTYEARVEINGARADILLPTGQRRVIRDARIADWAGSFATFEAYYDHGQTDSLVGFTDIWAQSHQLR